MPIIPTAILNSFLGSLSTIPATVSTYTSTLRRLDNDFKIYVPYLPLFDLTSSQIRDILKNRSNVINVTISGTSRAIPFFDYCLKTVAKNSTTCAVFKCYFSFLVVYELMGLSQPLNIVYSTWQKIWGNLKKGRVSDIDMCYEDIKTEYNRLHSNVPILTTPIVNGTSHDSVGETPHKKKTVSESSAEIIVRSRGNVVVQTRISPKGDSPLTIEINIG